MPEIDTMKQLAIWIFIIVLCAGYSSSFKCYRCSYRVENGDEDKCTKVDDNTEIAECKPSQNFCEKYITYVRRNTIVSIFRRCTTNCTEFETTLGGNTALSSCCTGDLCNSQDAVRFSKPWLLVLPVIAILLRL